MDFTFVLTYNLSKRVPICSQKFWTDHSWYFAWFSLYYRLSIWILLLIEITVNWSCHYCSGHNCRNYILTKVNSQFSKFKRVYNFNLQSSRLSDHSLYSFYFFNLILLNGSSSWPRGIGPNWQILMFVIFLRQQCNSKKLTVTHLLTALSLITEMTLCVWCWLRV